MRHPGPQKTRGRPVPAAGGRVAPHRMHRVGVTRLTVVFCTSLIVGRCAKLPRFVTDETGGSSICKRRGNRRGNRRGAAIGLAFRPSSTHRESRAAVACTGDHAWRRWVPANGDGLVGLPVRGHGSTCPRRRALSASPTPRIDISCQVSVGDDLNYRRRPTIDWDARKVANWSASSIHARQEMCIGYGNRTQADLAELPKRPSLFRPPDRFPATSG